MNDPVMDKIEQDLRAMSEESTEPTQLWKRALEVSRADERASLVHPGRDSEFAPKPTRGRRLFLTLNAVGVAAMVVLAAGVWTIAATSPSPVEEAKLSSGRAADLALEKAQPIAEMARAADMTGAGGAPPAPSVSKRSDLIADADESGFSADDSGFSFEPDSGDLRSRAATNEAATVETELADASMDDALEETTDTAIALGEADMQPVTPEPGQDKPGIMQMPMSFEEGLTLGMGNGTIFGPSSTSLPAIESAQIVIEVDNIDEAFVAVSDLPDAEQDEFSSLGYEYAEDVDDQLTLNISPARMDETLQTIRGMGKVVEEIRAQDNQFFRVNAAMNFAADQIEPQRIGIQELDAYNRLTPHERSHMGIELDENRRIETLNFAITDLSRRLQDARRSLNLSRVRVIFKPSETEE
jgi:hypothetical protein